MSATDEILDVATLESTVEADGRVRSVVLGGLRGHLTALDPTHLGLPAAALEDLADGAPAAACIWIDHVKVNETSFDLDPELMDAGLSQDYVENLY